MHGRPIGRAKPNGSRHSGTRPENRRHDLIDESFIAELRRARSHVDTLRARIVDANIVAQHEDFGLQALQELDVAHEELRVVEEELHAQADELLATRELLDEERRRYRELFNAAPEAYLVTNERGVVLEANRRAGVLFNVDPRLVANKPLRTFVALGDRDRFDGLLRRLSERPYRGELRIQPRKSDAITSLVSAHPATSSKQDGNTIRWMMQLARPRDTEGAEVDQLRARVSELERSKAAHEAELEHVKLEHAQLESSIARKNGALS